MPERDQIRDFLFDTSNFWQFERIAYADAVTKKNYPDAVLSITSLADEERSSKIPAERQDEISRHNNSLKWTASLKDAEDYCKLNGLKPLEGPELEAVKQQSGKVFLEFDKRKKEIEVSEAIENEETPPPPIKPN